MGCNPCYYGGRDIERGLQFHISLEKSYLSRPCILIEPIPHI
jgi:hypothetical protein